MEVKAAAIAAGGNNPQCRTGPWCLDCKAPHVCPSAKQAAAAAIEASGRAVPHDPSQYELSSELDILRTAAEALKSRLTALETQGLLSIENGTPIPGYTAERNPGRRKWKATDEVLKACEMMTGVSLFDEKPVTPAEAKRRKLDETMIKSLSEVPPGKMKLVKRDLTAKADKIFGKTQGT